METKKGYAKLHGIAKVEMKMTAMDAFKENNANGPFIKDEFISFVKGLRTEDYDHLDNLFRCMREGLRMNNSLNLRKDRGERLYYWGVFPRANANEGIKIIAHPGVMELLTKYRDGKVQIDFSLDDLIDEALS